MKKILTSAVAVLALTTMTNNTNAASGNATVTIIAPIVLTAVNDLEFGEVEQGASATTVNVGDAGDGNWTIQGEGSKTVNLTLGATTATLTGPGADIGVTGINLSSSSVVLSGGAGTFNVGGVLDAIPGAQTAGAYTGTYTVTGSYQ